MQSLFHLKSSYNLCYIYIYIETNTNEIIHIFQTQVNIKHSLWPASL